MSGLVNVSSSPHVRDNCTTQSIMQDVAIAMLPAALFGIGNFGIRALLVILVCVVSCVLTEYLYQKGMKQKVTIGDFSAVVTGMILALNLPVHIPLWIAVVGSVFAILVVKQLFGGLGQNFMNPALAARCFLLISFAGQMNEFYPYADVTAGATPLAMVKAGESVKVLDMFIGLHAGTIGEVSTLALLIGGAYLLYRKVISWRIPVIYIGSLAVFVALFGGHGFDMTYILAHICGGGLVFGAFFMATDYVTSPITVKGQVIFAVLLGVLTGIFRLFGGTAEGVSYAIIFCNLLVPLIEKITYPKAFGKEGIK